MQQETAPSHAVLTPTSYGRGVRLLTAVLAAALLTGCSAGTPVQDSGPSAAVDAPDQAAGARIAGVQTYPYAPPDHRPADGGQWSPPTGGACG